MTRLAKRRERARNPRKFKLRQIGCCAESKEGLHSIAVGPVAQVVEQLTFNQWVEGSNPSGLTTVLFSLSADRSFCQKLSCFSKNVMATAFVLRHPARPKATWDGDDEAVERDTDVRVISALAVQRKPVSLPLGI